MVAKAQGASRSSNVTWAQAFRDVFITSMEKGQLPCLGLIGIVGLLIWRLPEADLAMLAKETLARFAAYELISYPVLAIVLIAWYTHARIMRRTYLEEYKRIGLEKSELQRRQTGIDFKSSEDL